MSIFGAINELPKILINDLILNEANIKLLSLDPIYQGCLAGLHAPQRGNINMDCY